MGGLEWGREGGGRLPRVSSRKSQRLWFPTLNQPALGLRVCQSHRPSFSSCFCHSIGCQCPVLLFLCVCPTLVSLFSAPTHHGRAVSVVCWPVAAGAVPFWCVVCQSKGRVFFGAHRRRPWAGARRDCQWVSAASVQAASSRRQPLAAAPAGATLSRLLRFWGCCVDESRDRVTPSDCRGSVSYPPMTAFQSTAAATARTLRRPRSLFLLLLSFVLVLPPHDCASHVSSDNQVCSSVSTAAATVVPDRARWFL